MSKKTWSIASLTALLLATAALSATAPPAQPYKYALSKKTLRTALILKHRKDGMVEALYSDGKRERVTTPAQDWIPSLERLGEHSLNQLVLEQNSDKTGTIQAIYSKKRIRVCLDVGQTCKDYPADRWVPSRDCLGDLCTNEDVKPKNARGAAGFVAALFKNDKVKVCLTGTESCRIYRLKDLTKEGL